MQDNNDSIAEGRPSGHYGPVFVSTLVNTPREWIFFPIFSMYSSGYWRVHWQSFNQNVQVSLTHYWYIVRATVAFEQ